MDETLKELKSMRDFFLTAIEMRQKNVDALNVAITELEKAQKIENAPACGNRTRSNK